MTSDSVTRPDTVGMLRELQDLLRGPAAALKSHRWTLADRLDALVHDIARLGHELECANDVGNSLHVELQVVREALGVPYEPHQSLLDRTLEAAKGRRAENEAQAEPVTQERLMRAVRVATDEQLATWSPLVEETYRPFVERVEREAIDVLFDRVRREA